MTSSSSTAIGSSTITSITITSTKSISSSPLGGKQPSPPTAQETQKRCPWQWRPDQQ